MTDIVMWMIYMGGAFTYMNQKKGIIYAVTWPMDIGRAIATEVMQRFDIRS